MRQLSSKMTFFYKRVFPVIWFGFLLLFIGFALFSPSRDIQDSSTPFLIVALLMAVFGFWFMKKVIFNLADIVLDAGDALVQRHTVFGDTVAFCAPVNILPLWRSPVIDALIDRVDAARRK